MTDTKREGRPTEAPLAEDEDDYRDPDPCGICGFERCGCDDAYEALKDRLIEDGLWP